MSLMNLSDLVQTAKEDAELGDLPLPCTDKDIMDRFRRKTITDFSIMHPYVTTFIVGDVNLNAKSKESRNSFYEYEIPKYVYEGSAILTVLDFHVARPNGYSDFFIPNANWSTPDAVIAAMADVRMAAGVASSLAKAPTCDFIHPNTLKVYNGWAGGCYEVELGLRHDDSLATVPPGCWINLRKLATLDLKAYLYSKLKRKNNLEFGLGSFQLMIDSWESASRDYDDLLKEWDENGANLDIDHIYRY